MWETPENPTRLTDASRIRLVEAYDGWRKIFGRAERGSKTSSSELFVKAISNGLDLSGSNASGKIGLPRSRSAWSNWRAGRGKPLIRLRLDVCRTIMALTGVDVTANGFLKTAPLNTTDIVTLGSVRAVLKKSTSSKGEREIVVDWIDFHVSSPKDITLDMTRKNPQASHHGQRIGSVRFALREATIFVHGEQQLKPIATHLQDGTVSENGTVSGLEMSIDSENFSNWRLQPPFPREALQARVEALKLCYGSVGTVSDVIVGVSITRGDIEPSITLDHRVTLKNDEYQRTREKLIAQILRNRISQPTDQHRYIISHASAVSE